jgi:hypothetical protein
VSPPSLGDDERMAAAILVPLGLIFIARIVWYRANPGARLAAIGATLFALWALLAVSSLSAAMVVCGGVAEGIVGFIRELAEFIVRL